MFEFFLSYKLQNKENPISRNPAEREDSKAEKCHPDQNSQVFSSVKVTREYE